MSKEKPTRNCQLAGAVSKSKNRRFCRTPKYKLLDGNLTDANDGHHIASLELAQAHELRHYWMEVLDCGRLTEVGVQTNSNQLIEEQYRELLAIHDPHSQWDEIRENARGICDLISARNFPQISDALANATELEFIGLPNAEEEKRENAKRAYRAYKTICRLTLQLLGSASNITFDVFLSYNSHDLDHAKNVEAELIDKGVRVWMDKRNLSPGEICSEAIEQGIRRSRSVVVLLGPQSVGPWQEREVRIAINHSVNGHKLVIPVLLPGYRESNVQLPDFLDIIHFVDLRTGITSEGIAPLVAALPSQSSSP